MVNLARQAQTQGLPGTVPKPPPVPKTRGEQRDEAHDRAAKDLKAAQEKRWAGW